MNRSIILFLIIACCSVTAVADEPTLKLLFLGDQGHHQPKSRYDILAPAFAKRGIELEYTEDQSFLNLEELNEYDGLILYANIDRIGPGQADALLGYVESGKGFIPLHCATYCFRNSPEVVALMGGQFQKHGTGVMTTESAKTDHPIMKGYGSFSSWDETYVHHLHNDKNRTVLEYRRGGMQSDGNDREPWTWVRTQGKGRVFYTAWGHDDRTWKNRGFQNLVERGVRWACGDDPALAELLPEEFSFPVPEMTEIPKDVKPFEYVDVGKEIPNYTPSPKWGVQAEPMNMMQKPLAPEESMKHLSVPKGFHVELFVSEPQLGGKPICMAWDERGRLWVAETYDYPNELQPGEKGRDRIRICEDTDADGRADKFTVFAEKLSIPTSIAFYRGGAIVQNGIETLYLKDTNGDDVADERRVMFSNWQLGDTHGGVSNFQYGLDNWIWAMQGYNNSKPQIAGENDGNQQSFRMGFFRFRPDGSEIEFIRSTNNNTWGLGISEEGLIFGSTANRNPSNFMPIPNRYYERVRGWAPSLTLEMISPDHLFNPITDKIRQVDHHGGYTAAAGHAIYTAREYPQEYWNRTAFVCGPTGKLVGTFVLEPNGAGFKSKNMFNLVASDDEWTAPIMAEVGPDGNVWIIDWYNFVVQHNPTPQGFKTGKGAAYETKLRDKKHGRIYRIIYDGDHPDSETYKPANLANATMQDLVEALKHPTMLIRKHAQRLLVESGDTSVAVELHKLVADESVDELGLNVGAVHALNTLKGLGLLDEANGPSFKIAAQAISHPSAGVRINAIRTLPDTPQTLAAIINAKMLYDSEPQVVLATLLAISDMRSVNAGKIVAATISQNEFADDRWLSDAATSAAAMHAPDFLQESLASSIDQKPDSESLAILRLVSEHFARGNPDNHQVELVISGLAAADPSAIPSVIAGLQSGWSKEHRIEITAEAANQLKPLFDRSPDQSKGTVVRLAKSWGSTALDSEVAKVTSVLLKQANNNDANIPSRLAAANQLIEFDSASAESLNALAALIGPLSPPDLSIGLIEVISRSTNPKLGDQLIAIDEQATPAIRDELIRVMLSRPVLTSRLLESMSNGDMQITDLSAIQRQMLSDHRNPEIRREARRIIEAGGATVDSDRAKVVIEKMPLTEKTGDVDAGKLVFTKNCATCHIFGGEGNVVGPNLSGMSVHPKAELLTHILDPSRSVESNFRLYSVETIDGLTISGLLASESRTAVEVIDTMGKRHSILRDDIEALTPTRKSAMPEGIEATVDDQGLVDLLEYLTQKGDFVPLPLDKVATTLTTVGMFYDRAGTAERLVFKDWGPKTFENVPFMLVDPQGEKNNNAIMLHGPIGPFCPKMPKSVSLPCNTPATAIHMLGGVGGWASKQPGNRGVSMIVRLHYADGKTEDHPLIDGQHIADYIGLFDVPQSKLAFDLDGRQLRYLKIEPKRTELIKTIELVKPEHNSAPVVMAITVELKKKAHD